MEIVIYLEQQYFRFDRNNYIGVAKKISTNLEDENFKIDKI
jgi:hypothetical protein